MTRDPRERLRSYLFGELIPLPPADWPADDANLFALGLDSIRVMRLVAFIEEKLGVRIPDESVSPATLESIERLLLTIHRLDTQD